MKLSLSNRSQIARQQGFTLLELLISVLIFVIITAITFSLFSSSIRTSKSELANTYHDEAVKSALSLMTAEIAQAGSHPDTFTPPQMLQGNVNSGSDRTVTVANSTGVTTTMNANLLRGINVGDVLKIYDSTGLMLKEDNVVVKTIDVLNNKFTADFTQNHNTGELIVSRKLPYRTSILPNSDDEHLKFFGDIFDDGQIYYIEYNVVHPPAPELPKLVRCAKVADGSTTLPVTFDDKTLIRNLLLPNPTSGGTAPPVFQYVADDQGNIVSVIITFTTGTGDFLDQRPLTLTTTVTARNVVGASALTRSKDLTPSQLPNNPTWINFISTQR